MSDHYQDPWGEELPWWYWIVVGAALLTIFACLIVTEVRK